MTTAFEFPYLYALHDGFTSCRKRRWLLPRLRNAHVDALPVADRGVPLGVDVPRSAALASSFLQLELLQLLLARHGPLETDPTAIKCIWIRNSEARKWAYKMGLYMSYQRRCCVFGPIGKPCPTCPFLGPEYVGSRALSLRGPIDPGEEVDTRHVTAIDDLWMKTGCREASTSFRKPR